METTTNTKATVRAGLSELIAFFNTASADHMAKYFPNLEPDTYEFDGGRKYLRVVATRDGGGRSIHCFIDSETGDVYKPATWKAPALNGARYNILDVASLERLKQIWDPYGRYLYKEVAAS